MYDKFGLFIGGAWVKGASGPGWSGINNFALVASEVSFGGTDHSVGREGGSGHRGLFLDAKLAQIVF